MTSVGETLRRERLKNNLELDQISRELKIAPRLLQAIEEERFDKLPGGVFTKSFVRQYARLLGLDDDELAGEVERALEPQPEVSESPGKPKPATSEIPLPRAERWEAIGERRSSWASSLPALALVVMVMLLCSGVYTWWQRARRPVPRDTTPPAVQTADTAKPAAAAAAPESAPPASSQAPPQASAERRVPEAAAPEPAGKAADAASPAATAPAPAPQAGATDPNAPVRVELTAQEAVWVRAQADGKYVFSGTLQPNESRTVDANGDVLLRLGNAGGIVISLNGKPVGEVGPKGQIRTVQLTSGGFKILPAPKPASPVDPF